MLSSEEARIRGTAAGAEHRECGGGAQLLMKPSSSGLMRSAFVKIPEPARRRSLDLVRAVPAG